MNAYDFDGTIYDGDSSLDFYKYCIKINKKCLLDMPKFIIAIALYTLKIKNKEYLKSAFFAIVKRFDDIDRLVDSFWELHEHKIKNWYREVKRKSDIIISASPEFLLMPICKKMKVSLIATKVDIKTGKLVGKNCHGKEKVERLKPHKTKINRFYSDSLSDLPLKEISQEAFIVKHNNIISWDEYKESFGKKMIRLFMSRDFIVFIILGVINVFNGVVLSILYSNILEDPIFSYIIGFLSSMTISYFLNSYLNFKERISWKKYVKFAINNIPNFVIQIANVILLLNILKVPKLASYMISSIVAVPITFILIKLFVFKKNT